MWILENVKYILFKIVSLHSTHTQMKLYDNY